MEKKYKKKLRLKVWVLCVIFFLFLTFLIGGSISLFFWHQDNQMVSELSDKLENMVDVIEKEIILDDDDMPVNTAILVNPPDNHESDYYYYMKVPFYSVDFQKLLEKNNDTVGFISVNGTNINYPFVYSGDNTYYLTHAFDKTDNSAGWIFLDYRNNLDELSDNTVIYGHGRVNGTVFGSLKNSLTKTWQSNKDNYVIRISSLNYNYVFQIFSIYDIKAESYYIETNFTSKEEKQKWIDTMLKRNTAPIDVEINTLDKFLTLSTCKDNYGTRIVVQAKLITCESR